MPKLQIPEIDSDFLKIGGAASTIDHNIGVDLPVVRS